jgi:hypothetical protein
MRLFNLPQRAVERDNDFKAIVAQKARGVICNAPESNRLKRELSAGDRILTVFNNDEAEIGNQIAMRQGE